MKKSKRKRFNQSAILAHFNAKCEYVDPKTRIQCSSQENLTTHHKNGDPSDDSVKNLEVLCLYHHRKREGILNKKRDYR
ncbi:MAG: hypothetical protein COV65_07175 [Nitrosopumilales archaeon CG11_big_fil_rev_8_21_14_0_20_33_24]|nr:MAG: hypothetical protein COV65_07175 [Nitrosopumilales archaeon CG11_big_fil_rev_8_21_14_0_20_33_24]